VSIDGGLRPLFRSRLPQFMWTSVETGATGSGVADSNYLLNGVEGWIEHKQTDASKIDSLNKYQVAWLHRRARCGGRVWIACRRWHDGGPRRGPPIDELWLVPGGWAQELRSGGLLALARTGDAWLAGLEWWPGGPARWPWDRVAAALVAPAGQGRQGAGPVGQERVRRGP